ncbi:MAG: hypothetical protein KGS72_20890 [Cyanobacteria bacterium REEB67]|nr:hypothetical protein [Cyanobacteria bacterium REEB67]
MAKNSKKQISFFVDEKLEKLLALSEGAERDRTINAALAMWFAAQSSSGSPHSASYQNTFLSFVDWLKIQNDPLMLSTKSGRKISLTRVLQKFARQEERRPVNTAWGRGEDHAIGEERSGGELRDLDEPFLPSLFEPGAVALGGKRCDVCQRVLDRDVINSPSRGRVCRSCSEFPGLKRPSTQEFRKQVGIAYRLLLAIDAAESREKETLLDLFAKHSTEVQETAMSSYRAGRDWPQSKS